MIRKKFLFEFPPLFDFQLCTEIAKLIEVSQSQVLYVDFFIDF